MVEVESGKRNRGFKKTKIANTDVRILVKYRTETQPYKVLVTTVLVPQLPMLTETT